MEIDKDINVNTTTNKGMGFCGTLTIVFIILKLTHVIDWSWWWVLSPIWIPIVTVLGVVAIAAIVISIVKIIKK